MGNQEGAPRLVGTSEAAELLGVEKPRIGRYIKNGRMPEPVCKLSATPIWRAEDIEAMRDGEDPGRVRRLELVGTREAAEMLGVERTRIGRWLRTGRMPAPLVKLKATPVWRASDVRRIAAGLEKEREERAAKIAAA
jgi:predicted DNA-binding transcriptional regulator AlpA